MAVQSLRLSEEVFRRMIFYSEKGYPYEICGALLGKEEESIRSIQEIIPLTNSREEQKETRYLISPDSVFLAEKQAEEKGIELLGFYHSHPDHPAEPSTYDKEHAFPWYSYLILSVYQGKFQDITAWRLKDDRSEFLQIPLPERKY